MRSKLTTNRQLHIICELTYTTRHYTEQKGNYTYHDIDIYDTLNNCIMRINTMVYKHDTSNIYLDPIYTKYTNTPNNTLVALCYTLIDNYHNK